MGRRSLTLADVPARKGPWLLQKRADNPKAGWVVVCERCGAKRAVATQTWKTAKFLRPCECGAGIVQEEPPPPREYGVRLSYQGLTLTIGEWATRLGVPKPSIYSRYQQRRGRSDEWVLFGKEAEHRKHVMARDSAEARTDVEIIALKARVNEVLRKKVMNRIEDLVQGYLEEILEGEVRRTLKGLHQQIEAYRIPDQEGEPAEHCILDGFVPKEEQPKSRPSPSPRTVVKAEPAVKLTPPPPVIIEEPQDEWCERFPAADEKIYEDANFTDLVKQFEKWETPNPRQDAIDAWREMKRNGLETLGWLRPPQPPAFETSVLPGYGEFRDGYLFSGDWGQDLIAHEEAFESSLLSDDPIPEADLPALRKLLMDSNKSMLYHFRTDITREGRAGRYKFPDLGDSLPPELLHALATEPPIPYSEFREYIVGKWAEPMTVIRKKFLKVCETLVRSSVDRAALYARAMKHPPVPYNSATGAISKKVQRYYDVAIDLTLPTARDVMEGFKYCWFISDQNVFGYETDGTKIIPLCIQEKHFDWVVEQCIEWLKNHRYHRFVRDICWRAAMDARFIDLIQPLAREAGLEPFDGWTPEKSRMFDEVF